MNNFDAALRQQHTLRSWVQLCGCAANRRCFELQYFGDDCHLFEVTVFEENIQGSLLPIRILRGTNGDWCHAGNVERPPGRQRFALSYFEACQPYLPFFHALDEKRFSLYELVGDCAAPSDPANGWGGYVQIYSGIRLEQRRSSTRTSRASQAPVDNQLLGTVDKLLRVAPMRINTALGDSHNDISSVAGIAFDTRKSNACKDGCSGCATCAALDLPMNSYERFYTVMEMNGTILVELSAIDLGTLSTFFVTNVQDGVGCIVRPSDIAVFDGYVVVSTYGSSTCAGLYVAQILENGQLGAFRRTLAASLMSLEVNGKWLIMGGATDGVADGQILMSRNVGCSRVRESIQFATDVAFNDIDSYGSNILAGGSGGALAYSGNNGFSWVMLNSPTSSEILSVGLCGSDLWIGTRSGDLWTSCNRGYSWSLVASVTQAAEYQLPSGSDGGAIRNIEFANEHVGYFTSGMNLWGTYSKGAYWSSGCPRFERSASVVWPGGNYLAELAVPMSSNLFRNSNHLALASNSSMIPASRVYYGEPIIEEVGVQN